MIERRYDVAFASAPPSDLTFHELEFPIFSDKRVCLVQPARPCPVLFALTIESLSAQHSPMHDCFYIVHAFEQAFLPSCPSRRTTSLASQKDRRKKILLGVSGPIFQVVSFARFSSKIFKLYTWPCASHDISDGWLPRVSGGVIGNDHDKRSLQTR